MKRGLCMVMLVVTAVLSFTACEKDNTDLVVYCYDSFASEWGPGPVVIPAFEKKYGIKVRLQSGGNSGQLLSRAILEKDNPEADIVIGIDNNMLSRALASGVFEKYSPENIGNIPDELLFDPSNHLTPFDYGYFSIIYDSEILKNPPKNLEDLTKKEYKNSLILMDPRTSSPGLGFLLWTIKIYKDKFPDYWRRLKPSILTITDGWSSGYGLFTSGEAPMVLSYTTSPAYHLECDKTKRYKAILFENGNYMQIEGAGILKNAPNMANAKKFIDFMIDIDFQKEIPLKNWMFPVNREVSLPDSFSAALKPEKGLLTNPGEIYKNREEWIKSWLEITTE